jgi:hypothetical protein
MMIAEQFASRPHLNSTNRNIPAVPLHMAIMLAVNSAADKSSCPFGSPKLLDIISLSSLACVSNDGRGGGVQRAVRLGG